MTDLDRMKWMLTNADVLFTSSVDVHMPSIETVTIENLPVENGHPVDVVFVFTKPEGTLYSVRARRERER